MDGADACWLATMAEEERPETERETDATCSACVVYICISIILLNILLKIKWRLCPSVSHLRRRTGRTVPTAAGIPGDDGTAACVGTVKIAVGRPLSPGLCLAPDLSPAPCLALAPGRAASCCLGWTGICSCTGWRAAAAGPELWPRWTASPWDWTWRASPPPLLLPPSLRTRGRSNRPAGTSLRTETCLSKS